MFLHLQLQSSMKAYGVPWNTSLNTLKMRKILDKQNQTQKLVNWYLQVSVHSVVVVQGPKGMDGGIFKRIWESIVNISKNPNNQQIHFNFIHKTYIEPRKHCVWNSFPNCDLLLRSFMHMFWDCREVDHFWSQACLYQICFTYRYQFLLLLFFLKICQLKHWHIFRDK